MLSPAQVAETYFLESRHMLLELAAHFDRYEAALARQTHGHAENGLAPADQAASRAAAQMARLREAVEIVAHAAAGSERTVALLELFARP